MVKGKLINDGGEGYIYEVPGSPHLLVKEFKEADSSGSPIVTEELVKKLKYMCDNPPEALVARGEVAWPSELIYDEAGKLKGFYMPRLDFHEHINRAYSYVHPLHDEEGYKLVPSINSKISIAINLCSAINELHRKGYVVGDLNHHNIGVNYNTGKICIMDCDSFHITDNFGIIYRTNVIMAGYLAPEIIDHCKVERAVGRPHTLDVVRLPTFTKESDLFCLAVHIFKLLMNGVDPFRGIKSDAIGSTASPFLGNEAIERDSYVFKPGNKPSALFCPPAESLPPEILSLFNRVFIDGRFNPGYRPGIENWYHVLSNVLHNHLTQCFSNPKHQYYYGLKKCPYCEADIRYDPGSEPHGSPDPPEPPVKTSRLKRILLPIGITILALTLFIILYNLPPIPLTPGTSPDPQPSQPTTQIIETPHTIVQPESITITLNNEYISEMELDMYERLTLHAYIDPINTDAEIIWENSNPSILHIIVQENGREAIIRGVGTGGAAITVKANNVKKVIGINVVTAITPREFIISNSDTHLLSESEIMHLSNAELVIARNEIYARHGMIFGSKALSEWFEAQSWYIPIYAMADFDYNRLSDIENKNVGTLLSLRNKRNNGEHPYTGTGAYDVFFFQTFWDSSSRYIHEYEIADMSTALETALHEIYARNGRIFNNPRWREYYKSFTWYEQQIPDHLWNDNILNSFELANVELLRHFIAMHPNLETEY